MKYNKKRVFTSGFLILLITTYTGETGAEDLRKPIVPLSFEDSATTG